MLRVLVDASDHAALVSISDRTGESISEVVRNAIAARIAKEARKS